MPDTVARVAEVIRGANFRTADKGYSSLEVHRLLDDVRSAAIVGEPLSPVIDARNLALTSYGYDTDRVADVLAQLRALDHADEPEPAADAGPAVPLPPRPVPQAKPGAPTHPAPVVHDANSIADFIEAAQFPMGRRGGNAAYHAESVDTFLDRLTAVARHGTPINAVLKQAQFPLEGRSERGYDARAVDDFLDRLQGMVGHRSSGRSHVAPRKTGRKTSGTTVFWAVVLIALVALAIYFTM